MGLLNSGYPQPVVNQRPKTELRITEEEFNKWREEQFQKALEEQRRLQEAQNETDDDEENDYNDDKKDTKDDYQEEDLYKKHKANKANSTLGRRETPKHKNHNYHQSYEATNYEKTYASRPSESVDKKKSPQRRPPQNIRKPVEAPRKQPQAYGFVRNTDIEAANSENKPQYHNHDPTTSDPTFYTTIPKDQSASASNQQDDIYSGLLSNRYDKKTVSKSKLLANINYNRKKQTKAIAASLARRSQ